MRTVSLTDRTPHWGFSQEISTWKSSVQRHPWCLFWAVFQGNAIQYIGFKNSSWVEPIGTRDKKNTGTPFLLVWVCSQTDYRAMETRWTTGAETHKGKNGGLFSPGVFQENLCFQRKFDCRWGGSRHFEQLKLQHTLTPVCGSEGYTLKTLWKPKAKRNKKKISERILFFPICRRSTLKQKWTTFLYLSKLLW